MDLATSPATPAKPPVSDKLKGLRDDLDAAAQGSLEKLQALIDGSMGELAKVKDGVGKVEKDQVEAYAQRKGMDLATAERWLAPNLNYDRAR